MDTQGRNSGQRRGSAHDRILDAASRRFYTEGIAATGVDAIITEAGVAKMSLYNNFASKSALVEAYVERRHAEWLALYATRRATAASPAERILAVFDAYIDHADDAYDRGFRGCGLLNAAAELPAGDAGRHAVRTHKEEVEGILRGELLAITTPERADALATHLSFLLEGSMARAGLAGEPDLLHTARALAAQLLATA